MLRNINMRQREGKKKGMEEIKEPAPVDGRSTEIFQRAAGAVSPSTTEKDVRKEKGELMETNKKGRKKKQ